MEYISVTIAFHRRYLGATRAELRYKFSISSVYLQYNFSITPGVPILGIEGLGSVLMIRKVSKLILLAWPFYKDCLLLLQRVMYN